MKNLLLLTCGPLVFASSACAVNIREEVASAFATAPAWFDERAEEVKGEGYPDIRKTPGPAIVDPTDTAWRADRAALEAAAEQLEADPRLSPVETVQGDDAGAWAKRMRARVEAGNVAIEAPQAPPD